MSTEENKNVIRAYVETIFNQKQVDRADELVASDYIEHAAPPTQAPGLPGAKRKWATLFVGIPDLRISIQELVAESDKVAVCFVYEGTHRGELLGIPATGKHLEILGISIFRVTDGKITEQWEQPSDRLALMQQLGVLATPGQASS